MIVGRALFHEWLTIKKETKMKTLHHAFFGTLDLEKGLDDYHVNDTIVLWEADINGINTTLWYDKGTALSEAILSTFAHFLNDFENYHQKSIKALETYLIEDDEYIVFHEDEVALDVPKAPEDFAQMMTVTNIGLWLEGDMGIVVDYMIAPEESDEILAVNFNQALEIDYIAWES